MTDSIQRDVVPEALRSRGPVSAGGYGDWGYTRRVLITIVLLALTYFVWRVSDVLILVFAAALLAVLLRALANLISRLTHLHMRWAFIVAIVLVASLVASFIVLFGSQIGGQIAQVVDRLPAAIDAVGRQFGIPEASGELRKAASSSGSTGTSLLTRAAGIGYTAVGGLTDVVLVAIASIYLASDPTLYQKGAVKLLPSNQHARVLDALDVAGNALRLWFGGQIVSMIIVGIVSGLAYWWIGLPSPLALAIIAAVTNFVPFLGPIIGAVPAFIFAFATDLESVLWTLGAVVVIQQIEGNIITPFVQQRAVSLPPVVILFAIVIFGLLFGLPGVLLAVPLAVTVSVLIKKLWVRQTLGERVEVPGEETD
jgi:predicted PurR-regulated permease PerM